MKRFCKDNPTERLGYQKSGILDIKKHKWFQVERFEGFDITPTTIYSQGFDWSGLMARSLEPPILPVIHNPTDVSNFDRCSKRFKKYLFSLQSQMSFLYDKIQSH